jgi:AraC-like DNA-binding protein
MEAPWGEDWGQLRSAALACRFNASALARHFGISTRQLDRHFRAALRVSPQRWLKEQRLQAAQQLLPSASSVKEVGYVLGFRQISQFCRDYRLRFGTSPSAQIRSLRVRWELCTVPHRGGSSLSHCTEGRCEVVVIAPISWRARAGGG